MFSTNLFRRLCANEFRLCHTTGATKMKPLAKVKVEQGTVVGREGVLPNGKPYHYFRGIPYAVPPVGELRFQAPIPLKTFATPEIDCTKEGDVSVHKDAMTGEMVGSENCLFLNVYAPKTKTDTPLPVMVYIHGGGFMIGSGNSFFYKPTYLIQENVIVVTLNYRLGALGFLSVPEGQVAGNMGLKDQHLVLQWVKENISAFNGDPNNVTLFGESAGAACTHLHLYSRSSRKLFHKAILQSGTSNMPWVMQERASTKAIELAKVLGCKSANPVEVVKFLRSYENPKDFVKSIPKVLGGDEIRRGLSIPVQPVVEQTSPDAIVTEDPLISMDNPNNIDIPLMMGYNSAEGIIVVMNAIKKLNVIENDLARLVPRNINLRPDDPKCQEVAQRIRDFYFKGGKIDESSLNALADITGDFHFIKDCSVAAEMHSRKQHKSPLYFYRFDYCGGLNKFKEIFGLNHLDGVCHADELFYVFQSKMNEEPWKEKDKRMVEIVAKLWTNFAKYGNPTPDGANQFVDCIWEPVRKVADNEKFNLNAFIIDEKQKMLENPYADRIDFWRDIYKMYNSISSKL